MSEQTSKPYDQDDPANPENPDTPDPDAKGGTQFSGQHPEEPEVPSKSLVVEGEGETP